MALPTLLVLVAAGAWLVLRADTATSPKITHRMQVPDRSTVAIPADIAKQIETEAIYYIPTHAPAGSEATAIFTGYDGESATGYIRYDARLGHPASFKAQKKADSNWVIKDYQVQDECLNCMMVN